MNSVSDQVPLENALLLFSAGTPWKNIRTALPLPTLPNNSDGYGKQRPGTFRRKKIPSLTTYHAFQLWETEFLDIAPRINGKPRLFKALLHNSPKRNH